MGAKDPTGSIQLRININGVDMEIGSTSICCKKSHWSAEHQKLIGRAKNRDVGNQLLSRILTTVNNTFNILSTKYEFIYPQLVKDYYLGNKKFVYSVLEIKNQYFQHRQVEVNSGLITSTTCSVNENYARHILEYCNVERIKKPMQIPATFFSDLFTFLIDGRMGDRMARKVCRFAKQMLRWAKKKGMSPALSCLEETMPGSAETEEDLDTTHLTVTQLLHLYQYDFKYDMLTKITAKSAETLEKERDAFVFNCFTGMHHCDYIKKEFRVEPYGDSLFLHGVRLKTRIKFSIKLLEPAVEILKKYNNSLADLPIKSNQKRNQSLKMIAAFTGIPLNLSTKIARKTFCDLALNEMLMPPDDVAACLGLTSTKHLKNYGRIREKRLISMMKSWDELKNAS
ncbi:hypothetical protein [Dyadobacter sp. CY323]|uniref:hypothetical protein n=1 Tax=Dyadobacter sp. CY323 TaxID=2907302 RepID=UPI001F44476A|nr:hypothetical protein [Dyadobacter sp. CY323]MCE6987504.1 hypothetical protein [Dyadobacter sp. CY323]